MTHFADLEPCTYFGTAAPLKAVGWLQAGQVYCEIPVELRPKGGPRNQKKPVRVIKKKAVKGP